MTSDFRTCLLGTLKFTIEFFEAHNIRYYAAYGTLLGAVRHQGLIPWDDDIDLMVPRADYERLLTMQEEFNGTDYTVISAEKNPGYYCPFAKIVNTKTYIREFRAHKYPLGVFIDIFPMDFYHESEEEVMMKKQVFAKAFLKYHISLKTLVFNNLKDFVKSLWFQLAYRPRREKFYREWLRVRDELKNADETGEICGVLTLCPTAPPFRTKWFENPVELPFENMKIRVPGDCDACLKMLYGDYMQLPPEEKRTAAHPHFFVDLNRHL